MVEKIFLLTFLISFQTLISPYYFEKSLMLGHKYTSWGLMTIIVLKKSQLFKSIIRLNIHSLSYWTYIKPR